MSVTLNLTAPTLTSISPPLSLANTFTASIAALNCGVIADYVFGTSASGTAPVIPIRNSTDLATYFNPQPDAVGTAVQNEEVERFTSFTAGNHVFNASDLSLTASLESGGTFDVVNKTLVGAVNSSNVLTFADTTGIQDGMMIASSSSQTIGTGKYVISHDSTTVTLNSFGPVTLPNSANVEFLPVYPVNPNTATTVSTITIPAGVPAGIVPGMFYSNITGGTFGIKRVVSTTGTTITLDGTVSVTSGDLLLFQPPVTSGQIWSKTGYQPGKNGANFLAFELTCTIPSGTNRGAWPAFWFYSKTSDGNSFDASEIDVFEFFCSLTASSNAYTSNIHGGLANYTRYQASVGSGSNKWDGSGFFRPGVDYSLAQHKFQLIWTPDKVYRYIDGQLIIVNDYIWSSQDTAQWSCDLACGSFITAFLGIYFYPKTTAQFPYSFKINEVKIWQG